MNKTKLILIVIAFLILAALWLQSTAWFRLQLADYYEDAGQVEKAVQIYEKILRKDGITDTLNTEKKYKLNKYLADYYYKVGDTKKSINHYAILKVLKPKREKDYFLFYYLTGNIEKLTDFILSNKALRNKIPEAHFKTPLWRFYLAKSLAKVEKWEKSAAILERLIERYPYLDTFRNCFESVRDKKIPKQDFPIIGMWKFDEGKGEIAKDLSGWGNHVKIKGAKWVEGINGYALSFDGKDDTVIFLDNETFNLDGKDFTIAMWIKPMSQKKNRFVYYKWRPSLYLLRNDNTWLFTVQDNQGNKGIKIKQPVENKWYFIVQSVEQGKEHKAWLFDTEGLITAASRKGVSNIKGSKGKNFRLSRKGWHNKDNAYFKGEIGGAYVFNKALSGKEVNKIYSSWGYLRELKYKSIYDDGR